jgi:hypothetical protein
MRTPILPRASFVLCPSVALSIAWFGGISMWALMQLAIVKYPTDPSVDLRLITGTQYAAVSGLHLVLALWYLRDARRTLRVEPPLRRAQLAGLGLAAVVLAFAQYGAYLVYGPLNR